MKTLVINNDGGGFADYLEIPDGTTVAQIVERQIGSAQPSNYLIRVNRQPCPADQVLRLVIRYLGGFFTCDTLS